MRGREIDLKFDGSQARLIYHEFRGFEVKTLLISFDERHRALSTLEGFKEVRFVGNHYDPPELWGYLHTPERFEEHRIWLCSALKVPFEESAFLFTGVDMDNLAFRKESFRGLEICCLATAGVKSNALRIGVDKAGSFEWDGRFERIGTINLILLTNVSLTDGAMAQSIITATEAKTSILQEMDVRSSYTPEIQATGTGTDNMIVVSGSGPKVTYTGGHSKMGELIGVAVRGTVSEAIVRGKEGIAR